MALFQALLVDDNLSSQLVQKIQIAKLGLEVATASRGQEAIDLLKQKKFDIVFMDIEMPGMDGFEATRQIREFNAETPIVALTAAAVGTVKEKVFDAGMNGYVSKPMNISELKETIAKYLPLQ